MTTAVQAIKYAAGPNLEALEASANAAIGAGFTIPLGAPSQIAGTWVQAMGEPGPGAGGEIEIDDITGLTAALASKADAEHDHVKADITDLVIVSADAGNELTAGTDGGALLASG